MSADAPARKPEPAAPEAGKEVYLPELSAEPEAGHELPTHEPKKYDVAFVRRVMDRPGRWLCGFCACYCGWLVLLVLLLLAGADVVPFSSDVPLYLRDHVTYERMDMKIEGEDVADWFLGADNQLPRQVDKVELELIWVYENGGNLLNEAQMEYIYGKEQEALAFKRYSALDNGFCTLANGTQAGETDQRACLRRDSLINYMNDSFIDAENISFSLYNDPLVEVVPDLRQETIDRIAGAWAEFNASEAPVDFAPIWEVVDSSFGVPHGVAQTTAARTVLRFGLPLKGYASSLEDTDEQIDEIGQFLYDTYDSWGDAASGVGLRLYYADDEDQMSTLKSADALVTSMGLIVGSVIFVWFYLSMMTSSCFIGSMGIFMLLVVFAPSIVLYRYMFQQQYFGVFNILSLFIVLGIGADDIFVMLDHWSISASNEMPPEVRRDQYTRMSWTYAKSGQAMLVTSITTAFAFLANSTSSFPGISTFGIFSATLVVLNYAGCMTFFTSALAYSYYTYERYPLCMAHRCFSKYAAKIGPPPLPKTGGVQRDDDDSFTEEVVAEAPVHTKVEVEPRVGGDGGGGDAGDGVGGDAGDGVGDDGGNAAGGDAEPKDGGEGAELGMVQRFFAEAWAPGVVSHPKGRYYVLLFFAAFFAVFLAYAVQLEPDPNTPQIHPAGTNYAEFDNIKGRYFAARVGDPKETDVFLIFGAKDIDRSGTNAARADDRGTIVWDDNFRVNTVAAQEFLDQICTDVADRSAPNERLVKEGDIPVLRCFMHSFRDWYSGSGDTGKNTTLCGADGSGCTFPVRGSHCAAGTDEACFDEAAERWALDPSGVQIEGQATFRTNIEEWSDLVRAELLDDGSIKLRMIEIEVKTQVRVDILFDEGIDLFKVWEDWMDEQMASAPAELASGFQMTEGAWHYYFLQETLLAEAYTGIALSLFFAFIVLTVATRNVIVSGTATLTITAIVICVMGFVVMAGWKLGILEAINLILVPGLAVDYVTHLADAYLGAHRADRVGRVSVMLTEVGVSIISGAISTLGASTLMFFAPVSFFLKFAAFIFVTILLSTAWSLGFYAALLTVMGPEHGKGSIQPAIDWVYARTCAKCSKEEPASPSPSEKKPPSAKASPPAASTVELEPTADSRSVEV